MMCGYYLQILQIKAKSKIEKWAQAEALRYEKQKLVIQKIKKYIQFMQQYGTCIKALLKMQIYTFGIDQMHL